MRVPARLVLVGDTAEIVMPDTVRRGEAFRVSVTPFAGGCRREAARTRVRVSGTTAEIRPYDSGVRSSHCASNLLLVPRVVTLRFDQVGTSTVRVHGVGDEEEVGDGPPVVLERRVVVR